MKEIPLTQGKVSLVDDDMYEYLSQWNWQAHKNRNGKFYAVRTELVYRNKKRSSRMVYMARVVMNAPDEVLVDHKDSNATLDNRRENLRFADLAKNSFNCGPRKRNRTGFKGVYWSHAAQKYVARIAVNKVQIHIGCFIDPIEAAKAYDRTARRLIGEFAWTNF